MARNRPVCFIGQEQTYFCWSEPGLFLLLASNRPVCWSEPGLFLLLARNRPISFVGQEQANVITSFIVFGQLRAHVFVLALLHSLVLARPRPMLLVLTSTNTLQDDNVWFLWHNKEKAFVFVFLYFQKLRN